MRILMLSDVYFPRVNGVSTSIQTFTRSFLASGHDVTLIAPDYPDQYEDELEFEIIRIPSMGLPLNPEDRLMRLSAIKRLAPQLKQSQFDILHIQTPFVAHYAGLYLAKELGLITVVSYHTFFEAYFDKYLTWIPSRWLRMFARTFSRKQCNQVDGIISPSHQMLDILRGYGAKTQAKVIGTGLQLNRFEFKKPNLFRTKYQLNPDDLLLLYVGRVAFEKNIEFLILMFKHVAPKIPNAKLLIVGEGPAQHYLERFAIKHGLQDQILFIGYLERTTELIACYHACDLFVFASQTETQGLVLLEAMACGLPVVSTASLGTQDVLRDGEGCLIAPLDENGFATSVLKLLEDPAHNQDLLQRGKNYIQQWSANAMAEKMIDFYRHTLGSGSK